MQGELVLHARLLVTGSGFQPETHTKPKRGEGERTQW